VKLVRRLGEVVGTKVGRSDLLPITLFLEMLAIAWGRMLESGDHGTLAALADAERISRSGTATDSLRAAADWPGQAKPRGIQVRFNRSRILPLELLTPDIVEATLAGRTDQALILERLGGAMPADCEEQRARLSLSVGPSYSSASGVPLMNKTST
jgi:hypothetical protein